MLSKVQTLDSSQNPSNVLLSLGLTSRNSPFILSVVIPSKTKNIKSFFLFPFEGLG